MKEFIDNSDRDPAAEWMAEFARATEDAPLPDPQIIWWKAQAFRRMDDDRRTTAALDAGEKIQLVCTMLAAIALLVSLAATASSLSPLIVITVAVSFAVAAPVLFLAIRGMRILAADSYSL